MEEVHGKVLQGDSFELIETIPDSSVSAVITDPPYFLDGMGDTWKEDMVGRKTTKSQTVKSLRSGMKFDKQQGIDFQNFMHHLALESLRILKPGGWLISFFLSSAVPPVSCWSRGRGI